MNYNQKIALAQRAKLVVGVDIAKAKHGISLRDQAGMEIGKAYMIPNTRAGFESLQAFFQPYNKDEVLIGMEPTGHYWKAMAYFFEDKGYRVVLVNPFHVHRTKEVMDNTKRKTDLQDSRVIGKMVKDGNFLDTLLLSGAYADLREFSKTRFMATQEIVRAKIRLKALIDEFIPEYGTCFKDLAGKTSLALLKTFSLPILKSSASEQEKIELMIKVSRGHKNAKKAKDIVDRLADSIGVNVGVDAIQSRVEFLIKELEFHLQQRDKIEDGIKIALSKAEESSILLTMYGVRMVTAAEFLGQTGPLKNFSTSKKLEKLAGLDLSEKSSGTVVGNKSFSKRGRDPLRLVLYKITLAAIGNDSELKRLYLHKVNVLKKKKMVAIGNLMVKVLRIIFSMVKNNSQYDDKKVCAGLPQIQKQA